MKKLLSTLAVAALLLGAAPVSAQISSTTIQANIDARMVTAKDRANQEITRRINSLNSLNTKVQAMTKVPVEDKDAISVTVQSEVNSLTTLNAKIQADTDLATLKTDIAMIATEYRVYMTLIPAIRIIVAGDRILATVPTYTTFATTLQTAITQAKSNGFDTTGVSASLADYNAKVADASVQANAALALVVNLKADKGDDALRASNNAAIQSAAAKIKVAVQDLQAARKDAASIAATIKVVGNAQPTVNYTVNGLDNITVNVGDVVNEAWTSTNAVSVVYSWTQDSTSCGSAGMGPFDVGNVGTSGTYTTTVTDCWANHTYVITVTATGSNGKTVSDFATIKVNPLPR